MVEIVGPFTGRARGWRREARRVAPADEGAVVGGRGIPKRCASIDLGGAMAM